MGEAMSGPDSLLLAPIHRVAGTVRIPGSKSISNRVLLLAALARGTTTVRDLLDSDDTRVMLEALARLGVEVRRADADTVHIQGCGGRIPSRQAGLFLGNAGTAFRPLTAVLALAGGEYRLEGVARMHERPIADLVDALRQVGARIDYAATPGYPPLLIHPAEVRVEGPIRIRGDVSSQFLTAMLMALPLTGSGGAIEVEGDLISKPYIEITLAMMRRFGVEVARQGWRRFDVPAAVYGSPVEIFVEGDASSASYFLAAGVIASLREDALEGSSVRVVGVGRDSIQGDTRFAGVLEAMGADVAMGENWMEARASAPTRERGRLRALDADLNHIPDAAMTAAMLALFADGPSVLRNIASWRVKETDRIAAMAKELRKLGAKAEEGADYLKITPPVDGRLRDGAAIDTYDDHRMAMCFSLAALGGVSVRINDPACVNKTFPNYFNVLESISTSLV
jgi:3-phosphoshikimate 1-carboxyvinyltransferase